LFGGYARSKRAGENAVLKMNGRQLPNGKCHLYCLDLCKTCLVWATTEIWSSFKQQMLTKRKQNILKHNIFYQTIYRVRIMVIHITFIPSLIHCKYTRFTHWNSCKKILKCQTFICHWNVLAESLIQSRN
jgi:hypothetical protein